MLCVRARVCVCVCLRLWRLCLVHPDTPVTPFALPADTASTSSALDNPDQRITADLGEFAAKVSAACLVAGSLGFFFALELPQVMKKKECPQGEGGYPRKAGEKVARHYSLPELL